MNQIQRQLQSHITKSESTPHACDNMSLHTDVLSASASIAQDQRVAFIHHAHPHFAQVIKHNEAHLTHMTDVDIDRIRISPTRSTSTQRSISSQRVGSDFEYALPQYAHAKKHASECDHKVSNNSSSNNITVNIDNHQHNQKENAQNAQNAIPHVVNAKHVEHHSQSDDSGSQDDADEGVKSVSDCLVEQVEMQGNKSKSSSTSSICSSGSSSSSSCDSGNEHKLPMQSVKDASVAVDESTQPQMTKAMQSLLQFTQYYNDKTKQYNSHKMSEAMQCANVQQKQHVKELVVESGYVLGHPIKSKKCHKTTNKKSVTTSDNVDKTKTQIATSSQQIKFSDNHKNNKLSIPDRIVDVNEFVTALAVHNDYVAIGNGLGQVGVMQKRAMTLAQLATFTNLLRSSRKTTNNSNNNKISRYTLTNSSVACNNNKQLANDAVSWKGKNTNVELRSSSLSPSSSSLSSPHSRSVETRINTRVRQHYQYLFSQRVYSPCFDPLQSEEISPRVNALAFLPHSLSPSAFLLTTNEVAPRLYKIVRTRPTAQPFRAVDKFNNGSRSINLLMRNMPTHSASASSVLPQQSQLQEQTSTLQNQSTHTVTMKCVCSYAKVNENCIHTICPVPHNHQFITADRSTIRLWCVDYPDNAMDTFNVTQFEQSQAIKSSLAANDVIRTVRIFPQQPFLLFIVMASGAIRVLDTRQSLRWNTQVAQTFISTPRRYHENNSNYCGKDRWGESANILGDCALSPCGRYIAGRSLLTVYLWDTRLAVRSNKPQHGYKQRRVSWSNTCNASVNSISSANNNNDNNNCASSTCSMNVVKQWQLCPRLHKLMDVLYELNMHHESFTIQFVTDYQVATGGFGNQLYMMNVVKSKEDKSCTIKAKVIKSTNTTNSLSERRSDNYYNNHKQMDAEKLSQVQYKNQESDVQVFQLPVWRNDTSLPHLPLHMTYQGHYMKTNNSNYNKDDSHGQCENSADAKGENHNYLNSPSSALLPGFEQDVDLSTRISLLSRPTASLTGLCEMMCACNDVVYQLHYNTLS